MNVLDGPVRRALACGRGAALLLALASTLAPAFGASRSGLRVEGRILAPDGKAVVPGAVVMLVHLQTRAVHRSELSGDDGRFRLSDLPYGYYQVAVEAAETLYAVPRPVSLEPGRDRRQDVRLLPAPEASEAVEGVDEGVFVSGLDRRARALAELPGEGATPFLKSQLGITAIAGGAVLLLFLFL